MVRRMKKLKDLEDLVELKARCCYTGLTLILAPVAGAGAGESVRVPHLFLKTPRRSTSFHPNLIILYKLAII